MAPESVLKLVTVLLAVSVGVECGVLSGLWPLPEGLYHLIHLLLMALLLAGVLALWRRRHSRGAADAVIPLWFAAGLVFTGVGDYVNSALSTVSPVSPKLTWALLFFALGYSCYGIGMWKGLALPAGGRKAVVPKWLWAIVPAILVMNVTTWVTRVQSLVDAHPLLSYGSFAFNATIYVALPWLAICYLVATRFSVASVVVTVGVVFIVYSDLVLFDAWLRREDGIPIPVALYAINWILYFGGQCLTNVFAPSIAVALDRATAPGRENYSVTTP